MNSPCPVPLLSLTTLHYTECISMRLTPVPEGLASRVCEKSRKGKVLLWTLNVNVNASRHLVDLLLDLGQMTQLQMFLWLQKKRQTGDTGQTGHVSFASEEQ